MKICIFATARVNLVAHESRTDNIRPDSDIKIVFTKNDWQPAMVTDTILRVTIINYKPREGRVVVLVVF